MAAVVILGVYAILDGNLSVGGLIACTILTGRCLAPMAQVASILTRYHHSIASYNAIDRVMALPVERPEGRKFLHRPDINGDIEFRHVTFHYPEQQISAIKDISFTIKALLRRPVDRHTGRLIDRAVGREDGQGSAPPEIVERRGMPRHIFSRQQVHRDGGRSGYGGSRPP